MLQWLEDERRTDHPPGAKLIKLNKFYINDKPRLPRISNVIRSQSKHHPQRVFDLLVLIPLYEEFEQVAHILSLEEVAFESDLYCYSTRLGTQNALVHCVGEPGLGPAQAAVARIMSRFSVQAVILIGIAGNLSTDNNLGDVVVATEVVAYSANTKVEDSPSLDDSVHFTLGPKTYATFPFVTDLVRNFKFVEKATYEAWQEKTKSFAMELTKRNPSWPRPSSPTVAVGPIASADVVSASGKYREFLKKRVNRKFTAIETEASGVHVAVYSEDPKVPVLVIRGLSDESDFDKEQDESLRDESGNRLWRLYAIHNATMFLVALTSTARLNQQLLKWHKSGADDWRSVSDRSNEMYSTEDELLLSATPSKLSTDAGRQVRAEFSVFVQEKLLEFIYTDIRMNAPLHGQRGRRLESLVQRSACEQLELESSDFQRHLGTLVSSRKIIRDPPYLLLPEDVVVDSYDV